MANKIVFKTSNRDKFINKLYDEDIVEIEELEDDDVVIEELPNTDTENDVPVEAEVSNNEVHDDDGDALARIEAKVDKILAFLESSNQVADEELPVEETAVEAEQVEEVTPVDVDEDLTTDNEPTLYDETADMDEEQEQVTDEEVEEDNEEEASLTDSSPDLYSGLVSAKDSETTQELTNEINTAFVNRYKKFGGRN